MARKVRRSRRLRRRGRRLAMSGQIAGPRASSHTMVLRPRHGRKIPYGKKSRPRVVGQKRKRGYSETMTKQKNDFDQAGAAAQYQKSQGRFGRYRPRLHNYNKLVKRGVQMELIRYGAQLRLNEPGYFRSFNQLIGGGTSLYMPIHAFELTNKRWSNNTAGVNVNNTFAGRQLTVDNTGNALFVTGPGLANDGVTPVTQYQLLAASGQAYATSATTTQWNVGVLEWSKIEILFKCPKKYPGWFNVHLVQFTDDKVLPGASGVEHNAFWQKRAKKLLFNPISKEASGRYAPGDPGMRVLKTWSRRWNPEETTNESDYTGQTHRLSLFLRMNRFCNFTLDDGEYFTGGLNYLEPPTGQGQRYTTDSNAVAATGESATQVYNHPPNYKARVFLIIENTCFSNPVDTFNPDIHPSFDLEIRNKWLPQTAGNTVN